MNEQQALERVRRELKPVRYEHTVRVTESAEKLAHRFGADVEAARMAAILHDYAKYRPAGEMKRAILGTVWLSDDWTRYGDPILHAPAGAVFVKEELGVTDRQLLDAIVYHTTGKAGMSLLEKIIYLADYIEPGRTFPGVEDVRKAAETSLDKACFMALANTVTFLVNRRQPVFPDTIHAYNDLADKIK
ncbi:phosphohydrolase [Alteribacter lacisalsi]|jgi:predicted HD superfamily hydrolase involved in NAD metabolism|uniref:bis(5'-nucleosyl)-tetraphosphatase (symmetrical) n=1 Tax=Alteribacter lacisalsi TaxID=2045244 RepID=A0A2W0HA34_9BACI|nr:bis(5'-nucleosyl)-tetraphosphatase (symmetrical) YqeK [Alteribacter lacisalsi]PYZ98713.1 phosphohydrolase [Alteribacter lacisalsi]